MPWDDMNHSELLYYAQEVNPNAHRGVPRETLIAILEGEEIDLPERQVDKHRLQIMGFVIENWEQVRALINCPASSKSPRACFQCTDVQAVDCAFTNHTVINKKKEDTNHELP